MKQVVSINVSGSSRSDSWRKLLLSLREQGVTDATFLSIKETVRKYTRWGKLMLVVLMEDEPSNFEYECVESTYLGVATVTFAYNHEPWGYKDRMCLVVLT